MRELVVSMAESIFTTMSLAGVVLLMLIGLKRLPWRRMGRLIMRRV